MIAAPVQGDVDGVPKGSHFRKSTADGVHRHEPFVWTKPADETLDKAARGQVTLDRTRDYQPIDKD